MLAHRTRVWAYLAGTWQERLAGTPVPLICALNEETPQQHWRMQLQQRTVFLHAALTSLPSSSNVGGLTMTTV